MSALSKPTLEGKIVWKGTEQVSKKGGVYIQVEVSTHPGKKLYVNGRDYEIMWCIPVGATIRYNVNDDKFLNAVEYEGIIEDAPTAEEIKSKVVVEENDRQLSIETQFAVREAHVWFQYEINSGKTESSEFDPARITELAVQFLEIVDETKKLFAVAKARRL